MTEQEWLTTEDPMDICRLISIQQIPGQATHQIATAQGMAEVPRVEVSNRQIVLWLAACLDLSKHDYAGTTYYTELYRRPWRIGIVETVNSPLTELKLWCDKNQDKPGDPSLPLRAHLLRDVIGNPWQRVALTRPCDDCNGAGYWPRYDRTCGSCDGSGKVEDRKRCPYLTPQVLSLAQAAWEDRPDNRPLLDPFRLLLLADELEHAGCTESAILEHFRGADHVKECPYCVDKLPCPETNAIECRHCEGSGILSDDDAENCHIRGCWALDRILGQE